MITYECYNKKIGNRLINGTVIDSDGEYISNAVIILYSVYYCPCCKCQSVERIGYTNSDHCGRFTFNINIERYKDVDFFIEVFDNIKKI